MQRWHLIALAVALALGTGYVVTHRQQLGLTAPPAGEQPAIASLSAKDSHQPPASPMRSANIEWQKVDRSADGFKLEMPAGIREIQVPAYSETGGTDKVNMILSNPDADITFSLAWEDNPPVARVSGEAPGRTLDSARSGAMARTRTTLVSESTTNTQGYPGREFAARNAGGGILNSRLIYAGSRLYMLTAAFPSAGARHDRDVSRFFNSFVITGTRANAQNSRKAD